MTTLANDIGADDKTVGVDTAAGELGGLYRVGSEVITLLGQRGRLSAGARTWTIARGRLGTTAASHSEGAALTPYVPVVGASAFATGGAAQAVTLLGPVSVSFDTVISPGTFGGRATYFEAFALPDGCVVLAAWAESVVEFDSPGATFRDILFAIMPQGDDGSLSSDIAAGNAVGPPDTTAPTVFALAGVPPASALAFQIGRAISGAAVAAYYSSDQDAVSGSADLYALIATPA